MARRKRRIEYAYELAQINLERSRAELLSIPGFDARLADEQLPQLPDIDLSADMPLYPSRSNPNGVFASRSDYERTLRYLDRINRAASASYSSQSLGTPEGIATTLLTTFVMNDDTGDVIQSEFMRRESALVTRRENERRLKRLKEAGIQMKQTPVMRRNESGELEQVWTESGHRLMQWVPTTPDSERKYFYITQQEDLRMIQPQIPADAVVEMWGDVVAAQETDKRHFTPKQIANSQMPDYQQALKIEGYFANMQMMLDAVIPDEIMGWIDPVLDRIQNLTPSQMYEIYQAMAGRGAYAGLEDVSELVFKLDWLYLEIDTSTSGKMRTLVDVLTNRIMPIINKMEGVNDGQEIYPLIGEKVVDYSPWDWMDETLGEHMGESNFLDLYEAARKAGRAKGVTFDQLRSYRGRK